MKFFKKIKDNSRTKNKKITNIKVARADGYAQGCEDTSNELIKQIKSLNHRISQLTQDNLKIEENLRHHYEDRINILETRYTSKCKKCMEATESERDRLRKSQDLILDLIQKFNVVFVKVFKHASAVVDEYDNMIKSTCRVKSSKDVLLDIRAEADKIIQSVLPLVPVSQTENLLEDTGEIHRPIPEPKHKSSKEH